MYKSFQVADLAGEVFDGEKAASVPELEVKKRFLSVFLEILAFQILNIVQPFGIELYLVVSIELPLELDLAGKHSFYLVHHDERLKPGRLSLLLPNAQYLAYYSIVELGMLGNFHLLDLLNGFFGRILHFIKDILF